MEENIIRNQKRALGLWAVAFLGSMLAMGIFLTSTHYDSKPWGQALMLLPMILIIPMVRTSERLQAHKGCASPVVVRYNRRMLGVSFAYVIGLFAATLIFKNYELNALQAALLSLLPTLPVLGMIWAMGRYLIEETDEYLRNRTVNASLIATGFLLAVATFWGFLANFDVVRPTSGWAAVPVWCVGLGLAGVINKVRGA